MTYYDRIQPFCIREILNRVYGKLQTFMFSWKYLYIDENSAE